MTGSVKCRCEIEIGRSKSWSRKRNFGRAQMFGFLILVAKHCGKTFGEMLGDKIGGQAGKSSEMVAANSLKKCGRNWAAERGMKISSEFLFGLVSAKNTIGLMGRSIQDWHSRRSIQDW